MASDASVSTCLADTLPGWQSEHCEAAAAQQRQQQRPCALLNSSSSSWSTQHCALCPASHSQRPCKLTHRQAHPTCRRTSQHTARRRRILTANQRASKERNARKLMRKEVRRGTSRCAHAWRVPPAFDLP